jgi:hypothetical protein
VESRSLAISNDMTQNTKCILLVIAKFYFEKHVINIDIYICINTSLYKHRVITKIDSNR